MLFHFQLRSLAEIAPWGSHGQRYLHWFGLTDGWYWLQMDEKNEVFRYSPEVLTEWRKRHPGVNLASPYVDYQVVRLWEDMLELLPIILEPLPSQLAHMLEIDEMRSRWEKRVKRWKNGLEWGSETWEIYLQAVTWWLDRKLDAGYLTTQPQLWFWHDGQDVHVLWDNSEVRLYDILVWEAQTGQTRFTYAQFLDEVDSFHARLFVAMEERIEQAKSSWPRPEVALDMVALEKDHHDRSQWLARSKARAATRNKTPWHAVLDAIHTLERRFPSEEEGALLRDLEQ